MNNDVPATPQNDVEIEIGNALSYLHQPGAVFELAAINVKEKSTSLYQWTPSGSVVFGYYNDIEKAVEDAVTLDEEANADGVYVTLNPCNPALLARANNRISTDSNRTKDAEIIAYRNLLIDIDPVRPSGISSSDAEHEIAIETGKRIRDDLTSMGWTSPLLGSSGNGCHLIYKVDLPTSPETVELLKNVLKKLSTRYSNDVVHVDEKVFNPARLTKSYGTHARKGDPIEDRPHRMAKIIEVPESPSVVSEDQLRELAGSTPDPQPPATLNVVSSDSNSEAVSGCLNLDLEQYFHHYGVEFTRQKTNGDSTQFLLRDCVFDSAHSPNKASVIVHAGGGLTYQCFHSSCAGKTWEQARERISGNASLTPFMIRKPKAKTFQFEIISASDLIEADLGATNWIVDGFLPAGATILAGKPKIGKSFLALNLAYAIASGGQFLNQYSVNTGTVLYLGLEETQRRMKTRLTAHTSSCSNLHFAFSSPQLNNGFVECVNHFCEEHEDARLVVVDIYEKIKQRVKNDNNAYQSEYRQAQRINELANSHDIAIVLIHHMRKSKSNYVSGEDSFEAIFGSTGLSAAVDSLMVLERNGTLNLASLKVKGRDIEETTIPLEFKDQQWTSLNDPAELISNTNHRLIVQVLRDSGTSMQTSEIVSAMASHGVNDSTVRGNLRDMLSKDYLVELSRGIYDLVDSLKLIRNTQQTQQTVNVNQNNQIC